MGTGLRSSIWLLASLIIGLVAVIAACTSGEPAPTTAPTAVMVAPVTATPTPTLTATEVPPTPTYTPSPTDTPPPTYTPVPAFTPQPTPTAAPAATPRPTYTPRPQSTPTPIPTFAPRPTNTPSAPSPIKDLENGAWLDQNRRPRAMELRALPWVADGVDESEKEAAELLIAAARWYPQVFSSLMKMHWVGDSITPAETDAIFGFRWMPRYTEGQVDEVLVMSWVQDEITVPEGKAILYLYYSGRNVSPLADRLLEKSWVQDDITADEATVVQNLYWTARVRDDEEQQSAAIEAALQMLEMPFLDDVSGVDAAALRSLERLGDAGVDVLLDVMSHPTVSGGITDEQAMVVALLGGTYSKRPESVDVLLRGTGVFVEKRVIDLPLTGETTIAIVRIRDQTTDRMDMLEHSVRSLEEFMEEPLPISYIALYFDDATTYQIGGTNFGSHMTMSLLYDVENGRLENVAAHTIAHEVAHYYWGGSNQDWVDEGAAEFLGLISEKTRTGSAMKATNNPCASAQTIGELEALDAEVKTKEFRCNYSLGESFFLDLYAGLGEETFRQGFSSLYLKSQAEDYSDDCEGTDLGICHLVAAFKADVSAAQAGKVDEIVARWYGPLPGN